MNYSTYQLAIFANIASGEGHTVVNAVAGSGKTTTGIAGLSHIPSSLSAIFVAFNKDIAETLKAKWGKIVSTLESPPSVEISTLHSYGLHCVKAGLGYLRLDAQRVDKIAYAMYPDPPKSANAPALEREEIFNMRRDLVKTVSLAKGALASTTEQIDAIIDSFEIQSAVNGKRDRFISDVLAILEKCKETATQLLEIKAARKEPGADLSGLKALEKDVLAGGTIDFDDMIWLPVVLNLAQRQYDRVLGDEVQDFNKCQLELMIRALKPSGRFLGFGDPRQAIYRFRGADENAFNNIKERLGATELPLSVCYRCSKSVVREAQKLVPNIEAAPNAIDGDVFSVSYVTMQHEAAPGDFILSRTNAPLVELCMGFIAEGRRALIQGRDIGASLAVFVRKSKMKDVHALRDYTQAWCNKECDRLAAKGRDTQSVEDKAACILALSEGAASVEDVISEIEMLFADRDAMNCIVLSTTHKAKGLERDRVWVLKGTYMRRPDAEEKNLFYVAQTRAKKELYLVAKKVGE